MPLNRYLVTQSQIGQGVHLTLYQWIARKQRIFFQEENTIDRSFNFNVMVEWQAYTASLTSLVFWFIPLFSFSFGFGLRSFLKFRFNKYVMVNVTPHHNKDMLVKAKL